MWNVHNAWNIHMHRNPKNIRNTDDFLGSGTKLLLPSWLLGFQHEERERHNFYYADCSSSVSFQLTDPTNARAPCSKQLDSSRSKSQLIAFFQNTQESQHIAFGHDVIHIPSPISYPGFLLFHLWLSHPPRTSMNTCAQCVPLPVH